MIICFNCSVKTKKTLDGLLNTGQYEDYDEAISVAIANQAILQEQVLEKGVLIIGGNKSEAADIVLPEKGLKRHPQDTGNPKTKHSKLGEKVRIPAIFLLDGIDVIPRTLATLPSGDKYLEDQWIPVNQWLFAQYNKLLPAKANCRALAHILKSEPKGVPIEQVASQIAEEAAILGDFLRHHDKLNGIGRDDALSTAFPFTDFKAQKGRLRYANQFVASADKSGCVGGLLLSLKLINYTEEKAPKILMTEVGWDFAVLQNPILDNAQKKPTQKFTDEEISFLLDHISRCVPIEDFAYRAVLSAIVKGANTPEKIDAALLKYFPKDMSKRFLSSQRYGAISRMADLRLIERVRDGIRVSYVVTEIGDKFLKRKPIPKN